MQFSVLYFLSVFNMIVKYYEKSRNYTFLKYRNVNSPNQYKVLYEKEETVRLRQGEYGPSRKINSEEMG